MSKSRKQQLQEYQFDEASSGSDDSDNSDDEDDYDQLQSMRNDTSAEEPPPRRRQQAAGSNDSESDSDGDDSVSDASDNGSADSEEEAEQEGRRKIPDSDDDDDSDQEQEDSSSDEDDAPLHQRVLKKEGLGSMQRSSRRERKSRALEEATKRLASFKESQRKKKQAESGTEKSTTRNSKTTEAAPVKRKKKNKHKPTEVSSKRADFFARGARRLNESGLGIDIGAHRYKPMDPRASNLSGHFDEDQFHKNYEFLEEMRNKEIGQVRKRIAAHKATGKKGNRMRKKLQIIDADGGHSSTLEEDVARLKTLTETRANLERRKIDRAARQSVKRKIREDVESGKSGAYFLKRKEKKRLELEARFEELRKRGGEKAVEKMLARKRQKNKSRDASAFAK